MPKVKIRTVQYFYFFCPACKEVHSVNDTWEVNSDMNKPTFRPSVAIDTPVYNPEKETYSTVRKCHSYITDGNIEYLLDCKHDMAGKTVELPEMPENYR